MTDSSLLQDFIVETGEHLENTERNLLRLVPQAPDAGVLNDLFRSIHTIKGSSEYLGLDRIAELSHKLESLLDLVRRGERDLTTQVIDLLIDTNDRIAQLVDELSQHAEERAAIDDVISRLESFTGEMVPVSAEEAALETLSGAEGISIEDEFDEELFGIFVDQLKDGLLALCNETNNFFSDESIDAVLKRYQNRLEMLKSSANYMGYDRLKVIYNQWLEIVDQAAKRLSDGEAMDWRVFARQTTEAYINRVKEFFSKVPEVKELPITIIVPDSDAGVEFEEPAGLEPEEAEELGGTTLAEEMDAALQEAEDTGEFRFDDIGLEMEMDDTPASTEAEAAEAAEETQPELALFSDSEDIIPEAPLKTENPLLQDFIVETREHLEITERNLLRLEQQPDDVALLNEIFRSIHTIKGSSEYLGLDRIGELSHKLETLLDTLRRGECQLNAKVVDLLIATNDRIIRLVDDLAQYQEERAVIDDLLQQIEEAGREQESSPTPDIPEVAEAPPPEVETIEEEYDGELFAIFLDQLKAGLNAILEETRHLIAGEAAGDAMARYIERLSTLRSSANYMGYDSLSRMYQQWSEATDDVAGRLANGEEIDWHAFAMDITLSHVEQVKAFFPNVADITPADTFPAVVAGPADAELAEVPVEEEEGGETAEVTEADHGLLADFINETREHLEEIESNLLRLQASPDVVGHLNDIFRSVHTIKGSSEYLGMERTAELTHKLENLLDMLRNGQIAADAGIIELLIAANDRIGHLVDDLVRDRMEQTEIDDLISRIDHYSETPAVEETAAAAEGEVPESIEPEVAEPETAEPDVAELEPGEPEAAELETIEPEVAEPEPVEPEAAELEPGEPEAAEPEPAEMEVAEPPTLQELLFKKFADYPTPGQVVIPSPDFSRMTAPPLIDVDDPEEADRLRSLLRLKFSMAEIKAVAKPPLEAAPATEKVVYEELYDKELFAIFRKQLDIGLAVLTAESEKLASGGDAPAILASCIDMLKRLRSSANYMEYADLKETYEQWMGQIEALGNRLSDGAQPDLAGWCDSVMRPYIQNVNAFFPGPIPVIDYQPPEEEPQAPATQTARKDKGEEFTTVPLSLDAVDVELQQEAFSLTDLATGSLDETGLLSRLESAFDSKIEETINNDFDAHSKLDVVKELLSDDAAFEAMPPPPTQWVQRSAERTAADIRAVESFLFSQREPVRTTSRITPPTPLTESDEKAEAPAFVYEEEDRARRHPGRRQTDRFRDRLAKQSIRVDAAKIDTLLNQVGELVVTRAGFSQLFLEMRELQSLLKQAQRLDLKEMQLVKELTGRINDATTTLSRITSELQENVMKVRMLPIAQLFSRYPRVVHDLVRSSNKKVDLDIRGEETELDRMVIEQIADPLVHIIRNAVDHGIETPDDRQRKGKPEEGILRLEAYHEGNNVVIEISDDGRGIDIERIKAKALEKGFVTDEELNSMSETQIVEIIMRPGFSTADEVTHTSGRGVGMDVVKDNITKLNGTIETITDSGHGTLFRIKIPLTLAIIPALMVRVSEETFTIPLSAVDETLRIHSNEISTIEGVEVYYLRETTLPLVRVARVFKMQNTPMGGGELFVVVVNIGNRKVGLIVDQLKGREEVVIKPLEDYLQEKSGFSGATILGDGSISLIVDVADLVQLAIEQHTRRYRAASA